MVRMRLLLFVLLALALAVGVAACGPDAGTEPAADDGPVEEPATDDDPESDDPADGDPADDEPVGDDAVDGAPAVDDDEPLTEPPADDEYDRAVVTLAGPGDERVDVPVYVADEPALRQQGLMHREELAPGAGMVFVFAEDAEGGFWMKNTLIPLSIAFFAEDGEVLAVLDMEPCEADPCPSYDPGVGYRGTLEVNQGFFDEIGLDKDWRVELPADVEATE